MRSRRILPAARAAATATERVSRGSSSAAANGSALEARGGGRRDVFGRTEHDRALIAGGLAQIARDARLGVGQAGDSYPWFVLVDHAQALERANVDAVAAAAADLFLHHRPRPLGPPHLFGRVAVGVED